MCMARKMSTVILQPGLSPLLPLRPFREGLPAQDQAACPGLPELVMLSGEHVTSLQGEHRNAGWFPCSAVRSHCQDSGGKRLLSVL